MGRAERERGAEAREQWPALQAFVSEHLAKCLLGEMASLQLELRTVLPQVGHQERAELASEAFSFLAAFRDRHDDQSFLRDAFGVEGSLPIDDRGRGQVARARIKIVYDALAASLRRERADWKPLSSAGRSSRS